MFSFFHKKSKPVPLDLSIIGTDMHSHLLPGIDDGSPDTATSLQLIRGLEDLGYSRLITTPHVLWDLYRNDDASIEAAELELRVAAEGKDMVLRSAAEYMLDEHFSLLVRDKQPLRTLAGNYVLVEFSFVSLPFDWKQVFFDLQINGYQPVLAHPERYTYLMGQTGIYEEISAMGVLLQLNINSLTGYYGKPALSLAKHLVKHKLVHFLGTDLHHSRHLDAIRQSDTLMPLVQEIAGSGNLMNEKLV
ncbi:histidinol phosphatase [Flavihumibacter rivuli]|uniref:tyrosine-protein phosphatase n=1 Tax=Flavihumibacter rivuli TaxID=2838156 RepID=UPI001BDF094C|nr:CpsB/CapC family capsule biosynthesis tyrosine phosphatase [Flavihumibacter rivuli]ULQ56275.1 histidinol phosphatase [Flavihumibacter rivuli]